MRARFSWAAVAPAAIALLVALAVTAGAYGYHRDELYFRMLPPAWGYVDQPPLAPAMTRVLSAIIDEPWAVRAPAIACAVAAVFVVALIAREVGGTALAQGLAAWGSGFGAFALLFGHVFLTASIDLIVWPLTVLFVVRAILRDQPRWWLLAGVVVGLSMYNKLLIAQLLIAVAIGILIIGPRGELARPWPYLAVLLAIVVGLPNLVYQALNGWPQLTMGASLAAENGGEVRTLVVPFLLLLIGPLLAVFWIAGIVGLFRRTPWRPLRFLAVALGVIVVLTLVFGTQFYYPLGLLVALYAIGCVIVADWAQSRVRRSIAVAAVALNALVAIVISLPVIPVTAIGATPVAGINQAVADQIGWPQYAATIEAVASDAAASAGEVAVLTSNYGEAGALNRYGSPALPPVFSGHNALAALGPPSDAVTALVVVGRIGPILSSAFERCDERARLDNGVGVDNEEQGTPVSVCTGRVAGWHELWPRLTHLD